MSNDLPFGYQPGCPPLPGRYETIKVISHIIDQFGKGTWTVKKIIQTWNGQKWETLDEPTGWKAVGG